MNHTVSPVFRQPAKYMVLSRASALVERMICSSFFEIVLNETGSDISQNNQQKEDNCQIGIDRLPVRFSKPSYIPSIEA